MSKLEEKENEKKKGRETRNKGTEYGKRQKERGEREKGFSYRLMT